MSDREQNTRAARRQIEEFLQGANPRTDLESAVATLRRDDPRWLLDLQRRLDLVSPDPVCAIVASAIDEYASLGASAAQSMPAVAGHLASCDECREHLELYAGVEREVAAPWQQFVRSLAAPLVMTFRRPLGAWTAAMADRIGAWIAPPPPAPVSVVLSASPQAESRRLLLRLPDGSGVIEVTVIPSSDADWQIEMRVDPASGIRSLVAGIGDEASPLFGTRDLRVDRPAIFPVDPPVAKPHWLHLRWTLQDGSAKSEAFQLPFVVEE